MLHIFCILHLIVWFGLFFIFGIKNLTLQNKYCIYNISNGWLTIALWSIDISNPISKIRKCKKLLFFFFGLVLAKNACHVAQHFHSCLNSEMHISHTQYLFVLRYGPINTVFVCYFFFVGFNINKIVGQFVQLFSFQFHIHKLNIGNMRFNMLLYFSDFYFLYVFNCRWLSILQIIQLLLIQIGWETKIYIYWMV